MATVELDASIKQALRHLHSEAADSAEQVRLLLDELVRHSCGASKTMANALPDKYLLEEAKRRSQTQTQAQAQAQAPKTPTSPREDDGDLTFELLEEDLTCAVCRQISVQVGNHLVECGGCHALFHQDCHKPPIDDVEADPSNLPWYCAACKPKPAVTATQSQPQAKRLSPQIAPPQPIKSSSTSSSSSSSSSSKVITPNINIINNADKRIQIMKKKAAKQQENKRKHSK